MRMQRPEHMPELVGDNISKPWVLMIMGQQQGGFVCRHFLCIGAYCRAALLAGEGLRDPNISLAAGYKIKFEVDMRQPFFGCAFYRLDKSVTGPVHGDFQGRSLWPVLFGVRDVALGS